MKIILQNLLHNYIHLLPLSSPEIKSSEEIIEAVPKFVQD
jgi:hypothetical protein